MLPSAAAVPVPPPPAARSPEGRAELAQLKQLASHRTPAVRRAIATWNGGPAVAPWMRLAMRLGTERAKDPPAISRAYGLVAVAMYDAAVAAWHWKYVYRRHPPSGVGAAVPPGADPSYPSEHAAIAGAAWRVLAYAFPEAPAGRLEESARAAARSRLEAGVNYPSDVAAGLALGRRVADAVIARAKRDGYGRRWNGARPHGPAHWEPPPGSAARPVEPLAGTWRTWVLSSGSQLRPPPPPPYGSPGLLAEAREVLRVHRRLTPREQQVAEFWAGGVGAILPPAIWNQVTLAVLGHQALGVPAQARDLALVNVAMADAGIAVWDAKYAYWSPRPINVIRELGLDPHFEPLVSTPYFPSYVSGHAAYSGAASEVLAQLFPGDAALFRAKAVEAAMSRLWGGIHFRGDNETGLRMGREIGRLVMERARRQGFAR